MEQDEAIWSRGFARRVGDFLGAPAPAEGPDRAEVETLLRELAEDLRYLPLAQWSWIEHLPRFLGERAGASSPVEKLREVRSYAGFLRAEHPADEGDEWSDEDRQDCQLAARRRLEEEDPYPWPEAA